MPSYSTDIKPEPQFNLISESGVNVFGVITTALYGLLKQGKANCCEETLTAAQQDALQHGVLIFDDEAEETPVQTEEKIVEEPNSQDSKEETTVAEEIKKPEAQNPENQTKGPKKPKPGTKRNPFFGPLFDFAKTFVANATSEDENEEENNDNDQ